MIRIKDARPVTTGLFVTSDRTDENYRKGGIIMTDVTGYCPYQTVFRVGPFVKDVKEGQIVKLNLSRYVKMKYSEDDLRSEMPTKNDIKAFVPTVEIDGKEYLHIQESDVVLVVTDWEDVDEPKIEVMTPTIIM